jgi:hypothetical protein
VSRAARVLLAAVLVLAAALRAWNLDWEIGRAYHADEPHKVAAARALLDEGFADTGYFNHPYLILEGAAGVSLACGPLLPGRLSAEERVKLAGRAFSAIAGVLTVLAAFLLAREAARGIPGASAGAAEGAGLLAAALLAVAPAAVVHSRYFKEDAALALWTTLALRFALRVARGGGAWDLVLSTVAAALALSTKWSGGLALLLPPAAAALRWTGPGAPALPWRRAVSGGLGLAALAAGVFLLVNPQVLLYPDGVLADLRWEAGHAAGEGHGLPVSTAAWFGGWHLVRSLVPGLTVPLLAAGGFGLALAAATRERGILLLAGFGLLWYAAHEASPLKPPPDAMRYMVPLAPVLCAGAGLLLPFALRFPPLAGRTAGPAAALALFVGFLPALRTVEVTAGIARDTRTAALEWCLANLPPDEFPWCDPYGPSLPRLVYDSPWAREGGADFSAPDVPTFITTSSFSRDRYYERGTGDSPVVRRARAYYDRIEKEWGEPIVVFEAPGGPFAFHNPVIRVYRRPHR